VLSQCFGVLGQGIDPPARRSVSDPSQVWRATHCDWNSKAMPEVTAHRVNIGRERLASRPRATFAVVSEKLDVTID